VLAVNDDDDRSAGEVWLSSGVLVPDAPDLVVVTGEPNRLVNPEEGRWTSIRGDLRA
jgi:hypothetical protein